MTDAFGPTSQFYVSQRLRLHYVSWGNDTAPPLLLVHGGRDHCRSWDWLAQALRDRYHIIALDLRGHGDSAWAVGTSYPLVDFIYDVAQLVQQKGLAPLSLIAHSMGGAISLLYAGTYPEALRRLVVIDGLIASPRAMEQRFNAPLDERIKKWVAQMHDLSGRLPKRYATMEEAIARMRTENPRLSEEHARHLTVHGINQNEDGTYSWKFDNYVRAFAPFGLKTDEVTGLWSRVSCPTLLIRGTETFTSDPVTDGSLAYFKSAKTVTIAGAGHWVHHDKLGELLGHVEPFLV